MKFKVLTTLAIFVAVVFTSCTDDTTAIGNWVKIGNFQGKSRAYGASFTINNQGYFGLGKDDDDYFSDFWKLNTEKNSWNRVADFPGIPRSFCVSVSTSKKGYVGLGYDGDNDLSDFYEYDPETDSWTKIADFPGGPRRYATGFAIGDDIYVGTGTSEKDKVYWNDFYKYSNGSWSEISPLPDQKRKGSTVVTYKGCAYLIGGYHNGLVDDFWKYDPQQDKWEPLEDLTKEDYGNSSVPRWMAVSFASEGSIYLASGITSSGASLSSIYEWNDTDSVWTEKTNIESNVTRQGAGGFVIDNCGYIIGGCNGGDNYFDDYYKFEPLVEKNTDDN
ncbi:MAG TPA: kelch repeat-containing protein [Prolixibacteraceae bacterium]|nr:kelch repeat-containing protein [Prolixibacteraceae bacterium]